MVASGSGWEKNMNKNTSSVLKVLTAGGHQCILYLLVHKSKDNKHIRGKRNDSAGIQKKK